MADRRGAQLRARAGIVLTAAVQHKDIARSMVAELFEARESAHPDGSVGAELELIPVRANTHESIGIDDSAAGTGTATIARAAARVAGWVETVDSYGAPSWITSEGGRLCYEPGGQFEISSPVYRITTDLESFLTRTVSILRDAARTEGALLLAVGVDPYNRLEQVPAQLHAPRYEGMERHFNMIGPTGARMMRQTASLQLNVELGPDPMRRWSLLNALAPYLTAACANSPVYAGARTNCASYRARLWQTLGAGRTGIPFDESDPIDRYTTFARDADRIVADDRAHLTTLFPEVRPRGYFELRSMDSMEPERAGEAIRFVSALIHDPDVAAEASLVLGAPNAAMLEQAAIHGRRDPQIAERLAILESLAAQSSVRHAPQDQLGG
ncbi:MAG: glutamate-cysteine ligase family protein [Gemmatimonadota bacterium]|nr:glutamate-cysteine ligase family protein [Gemmatimonadota bacterium]